MLELNWQDLAGLDAADFESDDDEGAEWSVEPPTGLQPSTVHGVVDGQQDPHVVEATVPWKSSWLHLPTPPTCVVTSRRD